MKTLKELVAPYPVELFLSEYWTQQGIHIAAQNPQKFSALFSWSDLNYLLNYHKLSEPDLRFVKAGEYLPQTHDPQNWCDLLLQGATLVMNEVHQRVPRVAQLAADLREDIGYETHINLYCSPADQRGFDCHYDAHEVLILQISGEKNWFVFQETMPLPTSALSSKRSQPTTPPYIDCVLKPGDLLYIPRGHWHYAIACQQPSLHLTIGIECPTGLDWLAWLMQELRSDEVWRQSLPPMMNGNTDALGQRIDSLRGHLNESLSTPKVLGKYIDQLRSSDYPAMPIRLPAQIGADLFPYLLMTRFSWSPLHRVRTQRLDEGYYQIQVGPKQVNLKGIPDALAEKLFSCDQFSLFDIAHWAPHLDLEADLEPLLKKLVFAGILQVETDCELSQSPETISHHLALPDKWLKAFASREPLKIHPK